MLKKIFIAIAVLIVLFVVIVALQPSEYRIERSATIPAPPAVVFDQVNDFHKWDDWSPWAKLDPAAKNSFEGAAAGEGAIFKWAGNDKVGEGQMTIIKSKPSEQVQINLEFVKPFADQALTEFKFEPKGSDNQQTAVTWSMSGRRNFMGKLFCLFMNMDKMIGGDFEKGLANMKEAATDAMKEQAGSPKK